MGAIASQITSLTIVFSTVYLDTDQRKHQSSVSLAFVRGIHRRPVNFPHKWPVTRKMFPFDDVIILLAPCDWNHRSPVDWVNLGLYGYSKLTKSLEGPLLLSHNRVKGMESPITSISKLVMWLHILFLFYKHGLTWIPAWLCNFIHYTMWGDIIYPILNFNGSTIHVWEVI